METVLLELRYLVSVLVAVILGFAIGYERKLRFKEAGIRTHTIVCAGSALIMVVSKYGFGDSIEADASRVAAQIVSGIGFLGAGVIISDGTKIKGINTAASIWASASVGILCCLDKWWFAALVAGTIVLAHLIIHPITEYITKKQEYNKEKSDKQETFYRITIVCSEENADEIKKNIIEYFRELDGVLLRNLEMVDLEGGNVKVRADFSTKRKNNELVEHIITHVGKHENIISTGWKHI